MSLIFFPGRTSTSMTSFLGCAHRWLFSLVAPFADFSPGNASHWSLFPGRRIPTLTSFSDCACQWLVFYRSRQSQPFFFMLDLPVWFFFKLCLSMDFLPAHTSPSLTSFSGFAHRWLFPRSRLSLILPQVTHVADFFPGRTSTSMASFWGCAHRWLFSLVAPFADFSPGNASHWSLFPGRRIPTLTSFSDCACQRLVFYRSRQSQPFFSCWICGCDFFFKLCLSMDFLPARTSPSLTSFSGCARRCFFHRSRPSLTSISGCAHRWLFPRSRLSLIFPQVTHVADFFFWVARVRRWLPS